MRGRRCISVWAELAKMHMKSGVQIGAARMEHRLRDADPAGAGPIQNSGGAAWPSWGERCGGVLLVKDAGTEGLIRHTGNQVCAPEESGWVAPRNQGVWPRGIRVCGPKEQWMWVWRPMGGRKKPNRARTIRSSEALHQLWARNVDGP